MRKREPKFLEHVILTNVLKNISSITNGGQERHGKATGYLPEGIGEWMGECGGRLTKGKFC